MFKKIVNMVNSIPLAGRLLIHPAAFNYWCAKSESDKLRYLKVLIAEMLFLIFGHAIQASYGINAIKGAPVLAACIFVIYSTVMILVCLVQVHLVVRALLHYRKFKRTKKCNVHLEYHQLSHNQVGLCLLVTWLGQLMFIVTFFIVKANL